VGLGGFPYPTRRKKFSYRGVGRITHLTHLTHLRRWSGLTHAIVFVLSNPTSMIKGYGMIVKHRLCKRLPTTFSRVAGER
jgi:hypothetical protein